HLSAGSYRVRCHLLGRVEERLVEIRKAVGTADFQVAPPKKGLWTTFAAFDGLPGSGAQCMSVETNGVMWFGHLGTSISGYDGNGFIRCQRDASRNNQDYIWSIKADGRGGVWAGSFFGLSHFDGANWALLTFPGWDPKRMLSVEVDKEGAVWVAPEGGPPP